MSGQFGLFPTSYCGCERPSVMPASGGPVSDSTGVMAQSIMPGGCTDLSLIYGPRAGGVPGMRGHAAFLQQLVTEIIVRVVSALVSVFQGNPAPIFADTTGNAAGNQIRQDGLERDERAQKSSGLFEQLGAGIDIVIDGAGKVKDSFGEIATGAGSLLKSAGGFFRSLFGS